MNISLLDQCIASGQASAEQIEAHRAAGEVAEAVQPPTAQPADAMRLADAIDPLIRHAAPDHLTMGCAAKMLRALATSHPQQSAAMPFIQRYTEDDSGPFTLLLKHEAGAICYFKDVAAAWPKGTL